MTAWALEYVSFFFSMPSIVSCHLCMERCYKIVGFPRRHMDLVRLIQTTYLSEDRLIKQ